MLKKLKKMFIFILGSFKRNGSLSDQRRWRHGKTSLLNKLPIINEKAKQHTKIS
jgi:hypothetical protein